MAWKSLEKSGLEPTITNLPSEWELLSCSWRSKWFPVFFFLKWRRASAWIVENIFQGWSSFAEEALCMLNSLMFTSLSLCRISGEVWCSAYLHVISTAVLLPITTAQEQVLLSSGFSHLIYFCNPYSPSFEPPEQFSEIEDCNVQSNSTSFSSHFLKFWSFSLCKNWGWETCAGYISKNHPSSSHDLARSGCNQKTSASSVIAGCFCEKLSDLIQSRFLATSVFSTRSMHGVVCLVTWKKSPYNNVGRSLSNDEAIANFARLSLHRWVKQVKRWRAVQEVL